MAIRVRMATHAAAHGDPRPCRMPPPVEFMDRRQEPAPRHAPGGDQVGEVLKAVGTG